MDKDEDNKKDSDTGLTAADEEYLKSETEAYEEQQKEETKKMMRAMYPQDFDENGNEITAPDWWPSSPQEYKSWEDSNDRN